MNDDTFEYFKKLKGSQVKILTSMRQEYQGEIKEVHTDALEVQVDKVDPVVKTMKWPAVR